MTKLLPWLGLAALVAVFGGPAACSSDDGGSGGSGGGLVEGGAATGGGGTAGKSGSGATGGTGGAKQTKLGAACASDAECGEGLTCLESNSGLMEGESPAKGYCTTTCTDGGGECTPFGEKSLCVNYGSASYCLEGCEFGPTGTIGGAFDPLKCHGRMEVACSPYLASDQLGACGADGSCPAGQACATDNQCHTLIPGCQPQCGGDLDCAPGFCNPRTGMCTTTPATGKSIGDACTPAGDGGTEECKGRCYGFSDAPGNFCSQLCTFGADLQCEWDGPTSGPAPGICMFGFSAVSDNGGPGNGDMGLCAPLCDCNDDCKVDGWICSGAWHSSWSQYTQRAGLCLPAQDAEGGIDPGMPCGAGGSAGAGGTAGSAGAAGGAGAGGTAGSTAGAAGGN
jgi:hypothetical protein